MALNEPHWDFELDLSSPCVQAYEEFITDAVSNLRVAFLHPNEENESLKISVLTSDKDGFLQIKMHLGNSKPIYFRIQRHDLYLVGFCILNQQETEYSWFEFKKEAHVITGSSFLDFTESYISLESAAGRSLRDTTIGFYPLLQSVYSLTQQDSSSKEKARSSIIVICMVCEAIRFKTVFDHILSSFEKGDQLGSEIEGIIRNWSSICKGIFRRDKKIFNGVKEVDLEAAKELVCMSMDFRNEKSG